MLNICIIPVMSNLQKTQTCKSRHISETNRTGEVVREQYRSRYNYTGRYAKTKKEIGHEKQKGKIGVKNE